MVEALQKQQLSQQLVKTDWYAGPITALLFLDDQTLIVASGRFLTVFSVTERKPVASSFSTCLPSSLKINGMEQVADKRFVITSDRTFAVYNLSKSNELQLVYYHGAQATDQITRVRISPDTNRVAILFAHNFTETFSIDPDQSISQAAKQTTICQEEQCILYSGDICQTKDLVAAGTVFRVLIVWKLTTGAILHRLRGHTGVIFDTLFLKLDDSESMSSFCIGSVSDDRSVRVWSEKGQIAEMYGHTSRIWKLDQLAYKTEGNPLHIVTSSEDATCKVWSVHGQNHKQEVTTLKGHLGKNVRALHSHGDLIASGGEDGSVKIWNLAQMINLQNDSASEIVEIKTRVPAPGAEAAGLVVADDGQQKLSDKQKLQLNQIKCMRIVKGDSDDSGQPVFIIVATTKGTLRMHQLTTDALVLSQGQTLFQDQSQSLIADFAVTNAFDNQSSSGTTTQHVVLAIGNGEVAIVQLNFSNAQQTCEPVLICRSKLCDIKLLSCYVVRDSCDKLDLLAANGRAEMVKAIFDLQSKTFSNQLIFKADQKVQFTAASLLDKEDRLVCGDTRGNLWLFDYQSGQLLSLVKSHSDRITGLSLQTTSNDTQTSSVIASSKDSFLNVFTLESSLSRLEKQQSTKSAALNIIYETHGSQLLGFNGLHCILMDSERDLQLIKVNTKGGNRPIRAYFGPLEQGKEPKAIIAYAYGDCLALAFKSEKVQGCSDQAKFDLLPSLHGREIMAAISLSQGRTLITGSEDTTFKVLNVHQDGRLQVLQTFSQHEASVRAFAKCKIPDQVQSQAGSPLTNQTHLVVSVGSKMQAHLFSYQTSSQQLRHLCRYNQQVFLKRNKTGKEFGLQSEGQDFRIMAAAIVRIQTEFYTVFGSSSGQLILERVDFSNERVSLRQIQFIQHDSAMLCLKRINSRVPLVACGFTNGSVSLYEVGPGGLTLCHTAASVHGFGVNAIDAFVLPDSSQFVVVTGGDDQNLCASLYSWVDDNKVVSLTDQCKIYGHSSCIKGVTITTKSDDRSCHFVHSSGYDQRFKTWALKINQTQDKVELVKCQQQRHGLSDMNGMCKTGPKVFLVGQGVQMFTASN